MPSVLSVQNVEKYYGDKSSLTKALDHISFHVDDGDFVSIMGASGRDSSSRRRRMYSLINSDLSGCR